MVIIYVFCHYPGDATTGLKDEISKGRVLYVSGRKPQSYPNGWRGKLVLVLYHKSVGATDGVQNIILMMMMEEKFTHIKLKTWAYQNVST